MRTIPLFFYAVFTLNMTFKRNIKRLFTFISCSNIRSICDFKVRREVIWVRALTTLQYTRVFRMVLYLANCFQLFYKHNSVFQDKQLSFKGQQKPVMPPSICDFFPQLPCTVSQKVTTINELDVQMAVSAAFIPTDLCLSVS